MLEQNLYASGYHRYKGENGQCQGMAGEKSLVLGILNDCLIEGGVTVFTVNCILPTVNSPRISFGLKS